MVIGFFKDNRLEEQRKRTERELERAGATESKLREAKPRTPVAEAIAQQEREWARRYLVELERIRQSYEPSTETRIETLREINAIRSPDTDPE